MWEPYIWPTIIYLYSKYCHMYLLYFLAVNPTLDQGSVVLFNSLLFQTGLFTSLAVCWIFFLVECWTKTLFLNVSSRSHVLIYKKMVWVHFLLFRETIRLTLLRHDQNLFFDTNVSCYTLKIDSLFLWLPLQLVNCTCSWSLSWWLLHYHLMQWFPQHWSVGRSERNSLRTKHQNWKDRRENEGRGFHRRAAVNREH